MNYGIITFTDYFKNKLTLDATCSVARQNTIVSTPLVGRAGSVKEYVQAEDWQVNIHVTIDPYERKSIDKEQMQRQYPQKRVADIMAFFAGAERYPFEVASDYLNLFDIHQLVIQSKSLQQSTHASRQVLTLDCISDTPYEMTAYE